MIFLLLTTFVSARTILPSCSTEEDCPQSLKNECDGFLLGCNGNTCIYDANFANRVVCENEIVTLLLQLEEVEEQITIPAQQENTFIFTQNSQRGFFMFGDEKFIADWLEFKCTPPAEGIYKVPYGGNNCWGTEIHFLNNDYEVNNLYEVAINEHIQLKYVASGTLKARDNEAEIPLDQWSNTFIFTITDGININLEPENKYVLKNSDKKITLNIENNLPTNSKAFIKLKQTRKQTNEILEDRKIEKVLVEGDNEVTIQPDWGGYGINQIEIQAFYPIKANSQVYIKSDNIITKYNVVDEIPPDQDYTVIDTDNGIDFPDLTDNTTILIIIIIIIIVGIILLRRR